MNENEVLPTKLNDGIEFLPDANEILLPASIKPLNRVRIEKILKNLGYYSNQAIDIICDYYLDEISAACKEDLPNLVKNIYQCAHEYSSEKEALKACENDSALIESGEPSTRAYLEDNYNVYDGNECFILFNIV